MAQKKKSRFSGAISSNSKRQKEKSNFGYISYPDGVEAFKEEPGKTMYFDIMPYVVTDSHHPDALSIEQAGGIWYRRPFKVHSIPNGEFTDKVVCPGTFGKPCPICEYIKTLKNRGADKKEWEDFTAKDRNLYVVIPKNHKEMDEKPYIWDNSQFIFQKALNDECAEDTDNEIFPDLEEGLTLKVRFTKESFAGHDYAKIGRIDFEERDAPYKESFLKKIPNLDEILIVLSYKELEMKLTGIDEDDIEDEDEEDIPVTRKKKNVKPSKPDPEPEEDEEDDEPVAPVKNRKKVVEPEEDDEDEDDEPPVKKPVSRKAAKKAPEPDPEDDEDEDEDEPIAPVKKTNSRTHTPNIGDTVLHKKLGECEIVAINDNEEQATLADEDGDRHVGIPFSKFEVISFGSGKKQVETKKEQTTKPGKNRCPNKHVFGKDFEKFKDCSDCSLWDDCSDEA
jgi:hypothetical protein